MMRLSSSLRRFRWLVFTGWLLALLPALYLVLTQSGHLTGGGFEVPGSQSLRVHDQLEEHYPDQGTSPLALVAAPRADASYEDMNAAAGFLQQVAKQMPDVVVVPNPAQPSPQPDRPYVLSLRLDGVTNNSASDAAKKLRVKVGVQGERPGQMQNGRVRLYVIGQGALSTAAAANTKHDIAKAEKWNLPIILIVLLAVFGSLAAAAIPLALGICTVDHHDGSGVPGVGVHHDVGLRHLDGVDVRHRTGGRLFAVHPDALPRGTARRTPTPGGRRRGDGDVGPGRRAVRDDRRRIADRHLPDQHSSAGIDGHRRDPRGCGGDADVDDHDAGGAGDLRPVGRQAVGCAALVAAPGNHPVAVLDALDRRGDAPPVGVGGGSVGGAARDGGARPVDGVGQQPASPVQLVTRDPRRGVGGVARRWVPGRSARSRCW